MVVVDAAGQAARRACGLRSRTRVEPARGGRQHVVHSVSHNARDHHANPQRSTSRRVYPHQNHSRPAGRDGGDTPPTWVVWWSFPCAF